MTLDRLTTVVIGGGVVGAACAYYLSERGHQVVVIDQDRFGSGCSHGNCGFVCPSHVLPLAVPGAVRKIARTALRRRSPIYVRPRWDPALWVWFLRFSESCNSAQMMEAARGRHALLQSSMSLFRGLVADGGFECEWNEAGCYFVYRTPRELEHYAEVDALLRDRFGVGAEMMDGSALHAREPMLRADLAGAWFYACDMFVRPERLMEAWRTALEARGVGVLEHVRVSSIAVQRDGVGLQLEPSGPEPGDSAGRGAPVARGTTAETRATVERKATVGRVVVATGAWAPQLMRSLGISVPVQPGKGYSITCPYDDAHGTIPQLRASMIFQEHKVAMTPMEDALRIGSTMEFSGYDARIDRPRLALLTDSLDLYLEIRPSLRVSEEWAGWRPMTYDGLPFIDFVPASKRVMIAAGHSMVGVATSTGTGRLVAEMLSGDEPHIDPAPYSLARLG